MKRLHVGVGALFALLTLFLLASAPQNRFEWNLPTGFPPPAVPEGNPMSAAKVELGRHLFYDVRLSGSGSQSCASCHDQARAFTDGQARSVGSTGEEHPRNAQTLTNAAYNATLAWANPGLTTIEQQILIPVFSDHPVELGLAGKEQVLMASLKANEHYQRLFREAYGGDPFTVGNTVNALASFVRSLISGNAPYDRYVYGGDYDALSPSAQRGLNLFFSERTECHHCHNGFNFSGSSVHENTTFAERPFHNTGLYNVDARGAYPADNTGIFEFTRKPEDMGKFRAPTLRNIELTAPYFHDGSAETLTEVVRLYEAGGRNIASGPNAGDGRANPHKSGFVGGFAFSDQEREDLVNFLKSLTDTTFVTDPRFSNPW